MQVKNFNDIESEAILINQMLIAPEIIPNVYAKIKPSALYNQNYAECYKVILRLYKKEVKVDELSFRTEAKNIPYQVFDEVTNKTPTASNWMFYADKVASSFIAREVYRQTMTMLENLTVENAMSEADSLSKLLNSTYDNINPCKIQSNVEMAQKYEKELVQRIQNKCKYTGYRTGLNILDGIILGIQKEYIVIGARPSLGKTALAEQIALYLSGVTKNWEEREHVKTLFIELEMSEQQLMDRAVANYTGISLKQLKTGNLEDIELQKIKSALTAIGNSDSIHFLSTSNRMIQDIIQLIRSEVRNNGVKAVFIDHIGLLRSNGKYGARWEEVNDISHELQALQRELNIPLVVMSQVTRGAEGKNPSVADIRGSGAIEEDADTIMFIERERQKNPDESKIDTKINVMKNRNGACGSGTFSFIPEKVTFEDRWN